MKNSILTTTFLAVGIALMPGFGLNFLSGNSVNNGESAENAQSRQSSTDVTGAEASPKGAVADQHAQIATKNEVASAAPVYGSSAK